MSICNNVGFSDLKDNGSEVHRHQCIDELEDRISSALKEIHYIWSMNNLSCNGIKNSLKARKIDLELIAEELENLAHALKEKVIEPIIK